MSTLGTIDIGTGNIKEYNSRIYQQWLKEVMNYAKNVIRFVNEETNPNVLVETFYQLSTFEANLTIQMAHVLAQDPKMTYEALEVLKMVMKAKLMVSERILRLGYIKELQEAIAKGLADFDEITEEHSPYLEER